MSEGGVRGCRRSCWGIRGIILVWQPQVHVPFASSSAQIAASLKSHEGSGLCEAPAAARSSFSFPLWLYRSWLPKVPVPSGWFGDRALAGPSLGTAAAFPNSALQNPAHFFPLIAPGLLRGRVSSCPIPACPRLVLGTSSHGWQLPQQSRGSGAETSPSN